MSDSAYSCQLYERSSDVDPNEWSRVMNPDINPSMDLRFLTVLNESFAPPNKTWAAIIRDQDGNAVGATYFSLYLVDAAQFLPAFLVPPTNLLRRLIPRYLFLKFVICGHPVGIGQSSLQVVDEANLDLVTETLEATASRIANQHRAKFILFKEFETAEADQMDGLLRGGYMRTKSVVTYNLATTHDSFDSYYKAQSKRTRANMRKYFGHLEAAEMSVAHESGELAASSFTEDVYRLYENVLSQAEFRFEVVPREFFVNLARVFPEEATFTFIRDEAMTQSFCCGLGRGSQHLLLYCGINYDRNSEASIYFNTLYRGLTPAFEAGARSVNVGQSADEFKRRLGCGPTDLFVFIKPIGWLFRSLFRLFG